jgi:hypothetical protein
MLTNIRDIQQFSITSTVDIFLKKNNFSKYMHIIYFSQLTEVQREDKQVAALLDRKTTGAGSPVTAER